MNVSLVPSIHFIYLAKYSLFLTQLYTTPFECKNNFIQL